MPEISEKLVMLIVRGMALGLGVVGFGVAWLWFSRHRKEWFSSLASLLIAIAFLIGEIAIRPVPLRAWLAILLLSGSGLVRSNIAIRLILIAIGSVLLASWSIHNLWLQGIVVALIFGLSTSSTSSGNLIYLLLPLSIGGILTIVPDTEEIGLLLGVLLPAVLLVWPLRMVSGPFAPLAGIIAWVIALDGQGRPASVLISLGCLGLLVSVPFLQLLRKRPVISFEPVPLMGAILLQILAIIIAVGLARTTSDIGRAAVVCTVALVLPVLAFIGLQFLRRDNLNHEQKAGSSETRILKKSAR